ncbi:non-canonical purine NTP pyrophosphatase [Photorhabdus viridis]|uniref:non-canonical purine NTP pyrophosphatase n=1 Tax=Photorhabdus viridis TaxID=3163327 RepID=UPI003306E96A
MNLCFYTSNSKKYTYAESIFSSYVDINLVHKSFDFKELQTDDPQENLLFKLNQVPYVPSSYVFIEDSTFHIDVLNGFPSLYTKYILSSLGIQGIINLLAGKDNRECYFINHLALRTENNKVVFFSGTTRGLSISLSPLELSNETGWSDLWQILKVTDSGQFYSQLTEGHKYLFNQQNNNTDAFQLLREHLIEREL